MGSCVGDLSSDRPCGDIRLRFIVRKMSFVTLRLESCASELSLGSCRLGSSGPRSQDLGTGILRMGDWLTDTGGTRGDWLWLPGL